MANLTHGRKPNTPDVPGKCTFCGKVLGTNQGRRLHRAGTEAFPKCRSDRRMRELGMWQGFKGVWWTPDLGLPDEDLGFFEEASETRINTGVEVPQKGVLIPMYRVGGFGALLQGLFERFRDRRAVSS